MQVKSIIAVIEFRKCDVITHFEFICHLIAEMRELIAWFIETKYGEKKIKELREKFKI